ncbi:MAG: hypothetical protein IPM35_18585 [Myxococcales bacterium]|nr:hypothetical protein [Myxococcales bacterium]
MPILRDPEVPSTPTCCHREHLRRPPAQSPIEQMDGGSPGVIKKVYDRGGK